MSGQPAKGFVKTGKRMLANEIVVLVLVVLALVVTAMLRVNKMKKK